MTGRSQQDRIATNLRTLLILEVISNSKSPLTPTEINQQIGLPKQSIHRLCQTLVDENFLIRDVSGKRLQPAPRTMNMARGLLTSRQQNIARHQILMELSASTGETVNFVVPEPDGMRYLDRVETDWVFRVELPIGSRVPFHCTASGKCFLASLDSKQQDAIFDAISFDQRTPNTITDGQQLREEIKRVKAKGYSLDNEELFSGMVALAVPVTDGLDRFEAALAFHGPTQRLSNEILLSHLDTMRKGAAQLAKLSD